MPSDWQANARQLVQQLRVDISTASVGGTTNVAAAKALRNTSDLYALLVAYSDLGGCRQMVSSTGTPARVAGAFAPACRHLERAAALFARATQHSDPAALVRATHEIGLAEPALVRAMLAIRRGST
ncbi:MAG: hypothetical protein ACTHKS_18600 [Gaiellaceae bacterium]